jgi:hypothetical protein
MGQHEKHQQGTKREWHGIKNGERRMGDNREAGSRKYYILGFASMLEVATHHHQKHKNE